MSAEDFNEGLIVGLSMGGLTYVEEIVEGGSDGLPSIETPIDITSIELTAIETPFIITSDVVLIEME